MPGLIGKKIGMTTFFNEEGLNTPATVVEVLPSAVTQVKTVDTDGYDAVQLGYGEKSEKNIPMAQVGHYKKAGLKKYPEKILEFRNYDVSELKAGAEIKAEDIFNVGDIINVVGRSKGKGFQGVVKRYNFAGVGESTHGQHNRLRAPGAIGACSTPSRVFKGMKMAGRTGNKRVKVQNLQVIKMFSEQNLVLVDGSVPGSKNSYLILEK